MGVARSQGVGVRKNWVLGISVGTYRGEGKDMTVKGSGCFVRFVFKAEFAGR